MTRPNPLLSPASPLEVLSARVLFSEGIVARRSAASLRALPDGQLLLAFTELPGVELRNAGALMLSRSTTSGASWSPPEPIYAVPGWFPLTLGGLAPLGGDRVRLMMGRVRMDPELGGTEPFTDWHMTAIDSADGGRSWGTPRDPIELFPCWTEFYGASNPHRLSDGRLLWAVMGTQSRDAGWQAGVTTSDEAGEDLRPPTIIAAAAGRDFSDIDLVRLSDGRFLAVIREHHTRQSVSTWSGDEGRTWAPLSPTPFKGSNLKLHRLASGQVICLYRDESPDAPGVSCSLTRDAGVTWERLGHLYRAGDDVKGGPGNLCGYPQIIEVNEDRLVAILHTFAHTAGIDLHQIDLRVRTG